MASKKLNRTHRKARTSSRGDAEQFGKNKVVENRLHGRKFKLVNGQLKEVADEA